VPEVTAAPLVGLRYLTVTLNDAPYLIDRVLNVVRTEGLFFAAAAALTTDVVGAAVAAGVATS
jgi:acetolactate synthase regulatory subunit